MDKSKLVFKPPFMSFMYIPDNEHALHIESYKVYTISSLFVYHLLILFITFLYIVILNIYKKVKLITRVIYRYI